MSEGQPNATDVSTVYAPLVPTTGRQGWAVTLGESLENQHQ